ncbi:RNase adaptor protein RapZ [Halioglobus japonicus]|uniref:RNase adapter RapZ n=1 Tax=Halioglobus japonicus TaxID=930805 RepID=A0AAP8MFW3_9GAMM|nr:RNase adapter RapZ [Halioglobus japonicus]AQA19809.1 RNase adaptor protein RapZ [Halioglobus japonicus]PLW87116.1 RNase adapter RapZ [Halioglobus japonicus]GHD10115.1 nucleotide-binding protein [Halioglobus japonicus]
MQLIIISGRSGSGKSTALHQLEDEGYYCIDNLPCSLLPALVEETRGDHFTHFRGTAVCIDARNAWKDLANFSAILESLPASVSTEILFLDAQEATLIKRFSETRRKHPLTSEALALPEAIEREWQLLESISSAASLVLDTSQMTIYELRDAIKQRLLGAASGSMSVLVQSFGFKRGVPADADLVFDVRMLPNPHWVKELRLMTGLDSQVREFLEAQSLTDELFNDIRTYLDNWLPRYRDSNRSYMTIALGCTGGQHRSVYLADRLFRHYQEQFPAIHLRHRELQ